MPHHGTGPALLKVMCQSTEVVDLNDMTIPFRPAPRAASGSTSGEKAEMARRPRRGRRGGVVL